MDRRTVRFVWRFQYREHVLRAVGSWRRSESAVGPLLERAGARVESHGCGLGRGDIDGCAVGSSNRNVVSAA